MTLLQLLDAQDDTRTPGRSSGLSGLSAAGAFHDLGNLIQVASAAINILVRTPDMPAIHSRPVLARARASLEEAAAIVQQTIGLIRDRVVIADDTDVLACLTDVAALVETMGEPGLSIEVDAVPGLPRVRCDPVGLRRAILNLVFNARDAMAGNGMVSLEARSVPAGVEIRVADDGIGMAPETIARVFDPFFTTKSDGLGGIGLPMVERFVRETGGEIGLESAPGIGTTVTMRLPATSRPRLSQQELDR